MKCLSCWNEISDHTAILTKSCKHLFCQLCSEKAFKKELSCPLCDTVLAKDGITEITLQPNESDLSKSASTIMGFHPQEMCQVLQLGLEFWAKQKGNETIKCAHDTKNLKTRLEEVNAQNGRLLKIIEDERLKKKSLQHEKDALKTQISELESRYAEKARSLRKMTELYDSLRQVHKRLLQDLRGVRDDIAVDIDGNDSCLLPKSAIEIKTVKQSDNREMPAGAIETKHGRFAESVNVEIEQGRDQGRRMNEQARTHRFDTGESPVEHVVSGEIQASYIDSNLHDTGHRRHLSRRRASSSAPRNYETEEDMFAIAPNPLPAESPAQTDLRGNRNDKNRTRRGKSNEVSIDYYDKEHRLSKPTHRYH